MMILDKFRKICVSTGNLINCKEFNKRAVQTPTEELTDGIKCTLHSWLERNKSNAVDSADFQYINSNTVVKVDKDDRMSLKLTVKLFLENFDPLHLNEAVDEVMKLLDVTVIDLVILALPRETLIVPYTLDCIKPLWKALEGLVTEGKIVTIGISDLDTTELGYLYSWAQIKPTVNQVMLESCCVMPPEMTAFATENDIQLLTHNDPKDIMPQDVLQTALSPVSSPSSVWKSKWIVRYSVVVKCRGIIQTKGYLVCTAKEPLMSNGPCKND